MGNLLLADLRDLHKAELESAKERGKNPPDCILSKDLDKLLHNLEERPWGNWKNGKGISSTARGRLLNKYEIRTETLRVEQEKGNGYRWKAFFSAWDSYLEDDSDDVSEPNAHISPPSHPPTGAIFVFSRRQLRPVKVPGQNPASRSRLQIPPSWGNSNPKNGS